MSSTTEHTFTDTTLSSRGSPTKWKATEVDGLEYLAGYLAKVFQGKYPWMGSHTYKLKEDDLFHSPSWVSELSRGGLMKPSSEWISIFKTWRIGPEMETDTDCTKNRMIGELRRYYFIRVYHLLPGAMVSHS